MTPQWKLVEVAGVSMIEQSKRIADIGRWCVMGTSAVCIVRYKKLSVSEVDATL
jgi:hypothetical protein